MMTLKQILEAADYRISGGTEFQWSCYGSNARYIDLSDRDGTECASIVFDTRTHVVYELTMVVPGYSQAFGWWNPDYEPAYTKECEKRKVTPYQAWDNVLYQRVDMDTALNYLKDIVGTYYDNLPLPEEA